MDALKYFTGSTKINGLKQFLGSTVRNSIKHDVHSKDLDPDRGPEYVAEKSKQSDGYIPIKNSRVPEYISGSTLSEKSSTKYVPIQKIITGDKSNKAKSVSKAINKSWRAIPTEQIFENTKMGGSEHNDTEFKKALQEVISSNSKNVDGNIINKDLYNQWGSTSDYGVDTMPDARVSAKGQTGESSIKDRESVKYIQDGSKIIGSAQLFKHTRMGELSPRQEYEQQQKDLAIEAEKKRIRRDWPIGESAPGWRTAKSFTQGLNPSTGDGDPSLHQLAPSVPVGALLGFSSLGGPSNVAAATLRAYQNTLAKRYKTVTFNQRTLAKLTAAEKMRLAQYGNDVQFAQRQATGLGAMSGMGGRIILSQNVSQISVDKLSDKPSEVGRLMSVVGTVPTNEPNKWNALLGQSHFGGGDKVSLIVGKKLPEVSVESTADKVKRLSGVYNRFNESGGAW